MIEEFRDIEGYEGLYQVSNLGRIKSLPREVVLHTGAKFKTNEKILKLNQLTKNRRYVSFSKYGKSKMVHRIVWETFIGPIPSDKVLDHISNDRNNNSLTNLQLLSHRQNTQKNPCGGVFNKCVTFDKINNNWAVKTSHLGKKLWLGRYDTKEDAILSFDIIDSMIKTGSSLDEIIEKIDEIKPKKRSRKPINDFTNYKNAAIRRQKVLLQMGYCGDIVKEWDSRKSVSLELSIPASTLSYAISNDKELLGYYWRYKN